VRARPVGRIAGKVGTVRASPPHVVSRHRHRAGSGKALGRVGDPFGTHPKPALGAQRGRDCDPEAVLIRLRRVLGIGAIVTPVEQGEYGHLRIGDLARDAGVPGMAMILNRSTTPTPWAPVPMTPHSTPPPLCVICMRAAHPATRAQPPGSRLLPAGRRFRVTSLGFSVVTFGVRTRQASGEWCRLRSGRVSVIDDPGTQATVPAPVVPSASRHAHLPVGA